VSVASAKLDGMQDFIELPVTHSLMMRDKAVIAQAVQFLQTGKFTVTAQVISK
jgi:triacylglycerol lipase